MIPAVNWVISIILERCCDVMNLLLNYLRAAAAAAATLHHAHHWTELARLAVGDSASRSPIMSRNDFSCVAASYLVGRATPTLQSVGKPAAAAAVHAAPRRRLRRQNTLTRASVQLSDKLVRQRNSASHRIGIQQRVAAIIGLLSRE